MAQPITWRNVATPNFGSSLAAISNAGDTILGGLNALKSTAQQFGQQQDRIADETTQGNTDRLIQQIKGTNDLGAYAALADTINPNALQGQDVDQNAILDAYRAREGGIMSEITQEQAFDAQQQELATKPIHEQAAFFTANGEFDKARGLYKAGDPGAGEQLMKIQSAEDAFNTREQKKQTALEAAAAKKRNTEAEGLVSQALEAARFSDTRETITGLRTQLDSLGMSPAEVDKQIGQFNSSMSLRNASTKEEAAAIKSNDSRVNLQLDSIKRKTEELEKVAAGYDDLTPVERAMQDIDVINSIGTTYIPEGSDLFVSDSYDTNELKDYVSNVLKSPQMLEISKTGKATDLRPATESEIAEGLAVKLTPPQVNRALASANKKGNMFRSDFIKKDGLTSHLLDEINAGERGKLAKEKATTAREGYDLLRAQSVDVLGTPDGAGKLKEVYDAFEATQKKLNQKPVDTVIARKAAAKAAYEKEKGEFGEYANDPDDQAAKALRTQDQINRLKQRFGFN